MRNNFPTRPLDAPLHTLSKLFDVSVGFVCLVRSHPFCLLILTLMEAVYCFICGRRGVAVTRSRKDVLFFHYIIHAPLILIICIHKVVVRNILRLKTDNNR